MRDARIPSGCACCGISRRQFLAKGCAACAGATGLLSAGARSWAAEADGKVRIRVIYALHAPKQPGPDWPNVGFDFQPVMDRVNATLKEGCPNFEFLSSMANGPEVTAKILEEDKTAGVDGYLVYQMNCWNHVSQPVVASGKPTLFADFQYGGSGGFLVYTAGYLRNKAPNFAFVASTRMEDLVAAVRCFEKVKSGGAEAFVAAVTQLRKKRTPAPGDLACKADKCVTLTSEECLERMKDSRILAVAGVGPEIIAAIKQGMGIDVVNVPFDALDAAWKAADKDQSKAVADQWQKGAARIADVSRETLETSAAMYLGMKNLLAERGANAITVNCLGGFYGNHIHAYPCLGFHQLQNDGLIGACECDILSTSTMVAMNTLTQGRPGYISDPVIDTATRQIIYAHCVASNRVFGPKGEANPYQILTHSEDRQGASVRSVLPLGYMTTSLKCDAAKKQIIFHRGKAVANIDDDRACRTKLAAEPVGDIEKLFTEWDQWGWHRVTVYGDLKEPVFSLADAMGWKVIEEA